MAIQKERNSVRLSVRRRPLDVREGGVDAAQDYDQLHGGTPPWLAPSLVEWLREMLVADARWSVAAKGEPDDRCRAIARHLRLNLPTGGHRGLTSVLLDMIPGPKGLAIIDAALVVFRPWEATDELEEILVSAGSAWAVAQDDDGPYLAHRVDPTSQALYDLATAEATSATGHLRRGWRELYGRDPDPGAAVDAAIKAVEAAAQPVVSPNDSKTTLGRIIGTLAANSGNWRITTFGNGRDGHSALQVVVDMANLVWTSQAERHGSANTVDPMTVADARLALHTAVTLVQAFSDGSIAPQP